MGQALYVTVLGMALVFLALAIVMFVTMILERLFRPPPEGKGMPAADRGMQAAQEEEQRVAAVIGAALAIVDHESEMDTAATPPQSVLTLERMSQGWKAAGRLAAMH